MLVMFKQRNAKQRAGAVMPMVREVMFSPIEYGFSWNGDWYDYDADAGEKGAKAARDDYAAEMRRKGYTVRKRTRKNNLRSMGGIGSGHPHIELIVPSYSVLVA